ncbi:DUF3859 domain-containing protein [Desulfoluna spongiiphila]|uniref:DUF3859 domain-containing protein n=1 Tax=Desulfoluna spongiiphila TaxID=419481 RepID=A0A1G5H0Z9_9BACT|nr:DUF3859 domain-containing protein [Desulfoluna spongiiphila]SCY57040.1 protein of unknown function [Desulfoluna spongiiphila]
MEQFHTTNKITFDPQDIRSIKTGLQTYGRLIRSEEAFTEDMFSYCNVYVETESGTAITLSDIENTSLAEEVYRFKRGSAAPVESTRLDEFLYSETHLFLKACDHPELKAEILDAAMAIVEYARKQNDTSAMWIDDVAVFGVDILYIIARRFPEYTYLLGAYFIPYWDTEHADYILGYLPMLVRRCGITRDLIKAFCYCDNAEVRTMMFASHGMDTEGMMIDASEEERDLLRHLRKHPDDHAYFKEAMKERFASQPFLQYSEDERDHVERPIDGFYITMLTSGEEYVDEDDHLEILSRKGVRDQADNEAAELHDEIEAFLGRPLVSPRPAEEEDDDDCYYYRGEATEQWQSFIEGAFDNGEAIWAYVEHGHKPEVLDTLAPCDPMDLAGKGNHKILKTFTWHVGGFDSLLEEFHATIRDLVYDHCDEDLTSSEVARGEQCILRFLDVFHRFFGQQPFAMDTVDFITDEWEMLSEADFQTRYGSDWRQAFKQNLSTFTGDNDNVFGKNLTACTRLLREHREDATSLLADLFSHKDPGLMTLAACALHTDFTENAHDTLTDTLVTYVETHFLPFFFDEVEDHSSFICAEKAQKLRDPNRPEHMRPTQEEAERLEKALADWNRVKTYVRGVKPAAPPRDLIMKAMKVGKEGLTPEELAQLQPPKGERLTHEEALEIMKTRLGVRESRSHARQAHYELFTGVSDHIQKIQITAYFLALMPLSISKAASRALMLMADLAPVKSLRNLSFIHRASYRDEFMDTVTDEITFEDNLERLKFPKPGIWAWKVERCQNNEDKASLYHSLMEMFTEGETEEDRSFFGKIHANNKRDLRDGLGLLPKSTQLHFFKDTQEAFPDFGFDLGRQLFFDTLTTVLNSSLTCPESVFVSRARSHGAILSVADPTASAPILGKVSPVPSEAEALEQAELEEAANPGDNGYRWLLLQETDTGYVPLLRPWIVPILFREMAQGYGSFLYSTRVAVVSASCPPELIESLHQEMTRDSFKAAMADDALAYVRGEKPFDEVAPIAAHAIEKLSFEMESYYDCRIKDFIWTIDEATRLRALTFLAAASPEGLEAGWEEFQGSFGAYIAYVKQVNPPVHCLFSFILDCREAKALLELAKEADLVPCLAGLKPQKRLEALELIDEEPSALTLLLAFKDDGSRQIRDLVARAKKAAPEAQALPRLTLVDFGPYALEPDACDETPAPGASVMAHNPRILEETLLIPAQVGTSFGIRFTCNDADAPEVLSHRVRILHPALSGEQGAVTSTEWAQNGVGQGRIFAGWTFETAAECVPGMWTIEIRDTDNSQTLLAQTFRVVAPAAAPPGLERIIREGAAAPGIEEIQAPGALHLISGELVVCDASHPHKAISLVHPLPNGTPSVRLHLQKETRKMAFGEIRYSNDAVASWHPAPFSHGKTGNCPDVCITSGTLCIMDRKTHDLCMAKQVSFGEAPGPLMQPDPDKAHNALVLKAGTSRVTCHGGYNVSGELATLAFAFDD